MGRELYRQLCRIKGLLTGKTQVIVNAILQIQHCAVGKIDAGVKNSALQ